MLLKSEDRERLKKIGVSNLLDLALIAPSRYENLYISNTPKIGFNNVLDATILSTSYNPKFMKLTLYAHNLDMELQGIIFHAGKFHFETFKSQNRLYVLGKLDMNYEKLQIVQPQVLEEIDTIVPKYKTKLQNKTMLRLIKEQVTKEALLDLGIDAKMVDTLYQMHNPSVEFVNAFEKEGTFSDETLHTLKYLEIYNHIQKLSEKRIDTPSKKKLNGDMSAFLEALPFSLTRDQFKVIEEIKVIF